MDSFTYSMPTEVVFGSGAIDRVQEHARALGQKAFIVTGRTSARACGALDKVLAQFPNHVVFDEVFENPTTELCDEAGARCRDTGCDFVIAIGGGSPLDAAKAIAALAVSGGSTLDIIRAGKAIEESLPIVAIPTTSGTGSEVTPYSVLVSTAENTKRTIRGKALFPRVAIVDPSLTVSLPREVTINTGLDALSQGLEGMASKRANPKADLLALDTCRIVNEWLPVAVTEPDNIEARSRMAYAAMLSGCVISQTGTTLVHGMGYYYTLEFGVAHGLANGLLLAPVFRYNARHIPEKVAAMAEAMGVTAGEPADAISGAFYTLFDRLDLSPAARDHGVVRERLDWCVDDIMGDASRFKNQVGEVTHEDVRRFFLESYEGACS